MAPQVQNHPNEHYGRSYFQSLPFVAVNGTTWCNPYEEHLPEIPSKNLSLKMESPPKNCQEPKNLGLQLRDEDSSSTHLTSQSMPDLVVIGETKTIDQCISSESVQDGSYKHCVEGSMKPVFPTGNFEFGINSLHAGINSSMTQIPYAYADPYYRGLFTAYGPQAMIRTPVVSISPARVPLPLDLTEDGPIYVNAKQYHGILRRRQIRTKLEAQNKLVRSRKPYLHESRHIHALKRVRGSGGRFLSTKKPQQTDRTPAATFHCASVSPQFGVGTGKHNASVPSCSGTTHATDRGVIFQQPDHMFSSSAHHMQGNVGLMHDGTGIVIRLSGE